MAVTIIGFAGSLWGIPTGSPELGCNVEDFSVEVKPEINEMIPGLDGQCRGLVIGDPEGDLKMSGETQDITTASSVFVATFIAAFVPVNVTAFWGRSAGGWYLQKGTIDRKRKALRKFHVELKSWFNLA